jgi:hypothetical protein
MRAANKKKGFHTCRYLEKKQYLDRFFYLADETFQLLEKNKINMKILKTLQLDERPYGGLSILPSLFSLSSFLILVVFPFNKLQSLGLEWRLMKELHANPEALKALVEKVNSSILVYLINCKSALLVLFTLQNNGEGGGNITI